MYVYFAEPRRKKALCSSMTWMPRVFLCPDGSRMCTSTGGSALVGEMEELSVRVRGESGNRVKKRVGRSQETGGSKSGSRLGRVNKYVDAVL